MIQYLDGNLIKYFINPIELMAKEIFGLKI